MSPVNHPAPLRILPRTVVCSSCSWWEPWWTTSAVITSDVSSGVSGGTAELWGWSLPGLSHLFVYFKYLYHMPACCLSLLAVISNSWRVLDVNYYTVCLMSPRTVHFTCCLQFLPTQNLPYFSLQRFPRTLHPAFYTSPVYIMPCNKLLTVRSRMKFPV